MAFGTCQCGTFKFRVEGSFGEVRYCHCGKCRRGNGTAFTANARVQKSQWTLEGPVEKVTEYEHKPGLFEAFCSKCGSPLYARSSHDPNDIRVRLGGFEGVLDVKIPGHVWTSFKANCMKLKIRFRAMRRPSQNDQGVLLIDA